MNRKIASSIRLVSAALLIAAFIACPASGDVQKFVVSLSGEKRLDVYSIDGQGELSLQSQTPLENVPGTSRFDHAGRNLYVGTTKPSGISAFRVQPDGLTKFQSVEVPAKPSYLAVSPNGQFLLAAYYSTGQVTVHRILDEGQLSDEPIQTITTAPRAHCVVIDRAGKFVFVPHTSPNAIYQFRMDTMTGRLSANDPPLLQRVANTGPRHLDFHPTAKFAYGSNEQGRSISQYSFDSETGLLNHLQTLLSVPEDFKGKATTSEMLVHLSGRYAYISNRGHGTIAVFEIDVATGKLRLLQRVPSSEFVRSFSISTDGRFLVAACQRTGVLISYRIATDGLLKQVANRYAGKGPSWVTFPPAASATKRASDTARPQDRTLALGQGTMSGEVSDSTILLQTRLTQGTALDSSGALPGSGGVASFEWSTQEDFGDAQRTPYNAALAKSDFIVREQLTQLEPDTKYFYRVIYGSSEAKTTDGPTCSFRTLPGGDGSRKVKFIVASCMNYNKFMHGREGRAGGPITATEEDKRLGFPAFEVMRKLQPDFFVGTGDIVYYDNKFRVSETTIELRRCWHEQFRFPRMIEFFRNVPTYWSKDDHDFRYNDSDNETDRAPLPDTGQVRSPSGNLQRIDVDFDIEIDEPRYVMVCLRANPDVDIALSDDRITGVLSLNQSGNTKVSKSAVQTPPENIGVDTFEFWLPERRPGGKNFAMEFDPPLSGFEADNIISGPERPTSAINAWVAQGDDNEPWLELTWETPQSIERVIVSLDTDFDHPMESVLMGHPESEIPFCASAIRLLDADGKILAEKQNNHQTRCEFQIEPTITTKLRVELESSAANLPVAVFRVRVFRQ